MIRKQLSLTCLDAGNLARRLLSGLSVFRPVNVPVGMSTNAVSTEKSAGATKRPNHLLMMACIVTLTLGLAACGNDEPEPTAAPTAAPTEAATVEPTEEPTEVPAEEPTEAPAEEPTEEPDDNGGDGTDGGNAGSADLPDIYTFTTQQAETAQFASLVERFDLVEKLQSEGPFTAFIPTNRAIESLPLSVQEDEDLLFDIVLHHIVEDVIRNQDLYEWDSATTLLGDDLSIIATDYGALVDNANLLGVTDQVNNGILYIIDKIIFPPGMKDLALEENPVAGEETALSQGNLHIAQGERSPIAYNTTPPSSGPHYGNLVAWQVYEEPIRYEQVVHNLEDAGVLIYYQCEDGCSDLVAELTDFVNPLIDEGKHIAVMPNDPTWTVGDDSDLHQDMGAKIAVVAWQKLLKLDEFDGDRVTAFIDAHEGIDHHARY